MIEFVGFLQLFFLTSYRLHKMNLKTNLLEEYLNFVDTTIKQNKYFKRIIFFIAIIVSLLLFFLLLKNLNE